MKGGHRHNHFNSINKNMIIDILTMAKIIVLYHKVYYKNPRCRSDRKYRASSHENSY